MDYFQFVFLPSFRQQARTELLRVLALDPLTAKAQKTIGTTLAIRLIGHDTDPDTEVTRSAPIESLYSWLIDGWRLDTEWLADDSGVTFFDDDSPGPLASTFSITPATHFAALGLWLVDNLEKFGKLDQFSEEPFNENGWSNVELRAHHLTCIALAFQAVCYAEKMISGHAPSADEIAAAARAATARAAAEALHGKPGGSREKRQAVQAAWASGHYSSRDVCAEQECAALGMSFSTARRALRGTLDPPSRS
jgi:hypothetical protein